MTDVLGSTALLRASGTCVLVDARSAGLPYIVHWGADLGDLTQRAQEAACDAAIPAVPTSSPDEPRRVRMLPERGDAYAGIAVLQGDADDGRWTSRFRTLSAKLEADGEGDALVVEAIDEEAGLSLSTLLGLSPTGIVSLQHTLRNEGSTAFRVLSLPAVLPIPSTAVELLDLTGRHMKERVPQRMPLNYGSWLREQRRGRTGHDAPLVLAVGSRGFTNRTGDVWAVHLAWSGHGRTFAERLPESWACVGAGEVLDPGELQLDPGQEYAGPLLYGSWSGSGLDGLSDRFSGYVRSRPEHPRRPRPVVLNTWEAVYWQHDLPVLERLADLAAGVGVELFVLDDGWFGSRRDDRSGLGDWTVSSDVWPHGLHPLVDHVRGLGMRFGLWVEPEMVNLDSDLARAHPEWLLAQPGRLPATARNQHVLDVANPDVFDHVLTSLSDVVETYSIDALKWDHNRDLVDPAHLRDGHRVPGAHAQTVAAYRLLDALRARFPNLEIESSGGGGGRADLGILARTDRVWTSDTNDPLERQQVQRWTGLLLPPELMGAHVGPPQAHTTGRMASIDFRCGTALFGSFGIEWDISQAEDEELERLGRWVSLYKEHRGLLHSGRVVNVDVADPGSCRVHGVVAADGSTALFAYVQLATPVGAPPPPIRLDGLDDVAEYLVRVLPPGDRPLMIGSADPAWMAHPTHMAGSALMHVGLAAPPLAPQQLLLLHLHRV